MKASLPLSLVGVSMATLLASAISCGAPAPGPQATASSTGSVLAPPSISVVDELLNGGVEDGVYAPEGLPDGWTNAAWMPTAAFRWEAGAAFKGLHSLSVTAATPNDAAWIQTLMLAPDTNYLLSGWVRTQDVAHTSSGADPGANLSLWGTWARSAGVYGTTGWTLLRLPFNSGPTGEVTVAARLGSWGGTTTGTAWFDDLQVTRVDASDPHPRWRVLVLVYGDTDFTYTDDQGGMHRVTARMSEAERSKVDEVARAFVQGDVPALTEGNMVPRLAVRFVPGPLNRLTRFGDRWWPSPEDTAGELDPAFDSVIVVWDPRGTDEATGQPVELNSAAGLTPPMGRGQAYTTAIVQAAVSYGHRNVFKHEWGHSILAFFADVGASPLPTVTNHASPGQYVHCPTGEGYVWMDETDGNPIPNSIYNDLSGFTHDYYSGNTATPDAPTRCLGITPGAWAMGGPRSLPVRTLQSPSEWLATLDAQIEEMAALGEMRMVDARSLQARLAVVRGLLERDLPRGARMQVQAIERFVETLVRLGRLEPVNGEALTFGLGFLEASTAPSP